VVLPSCEYFTFREERGRNIEYRNFLHFREGNRYHIGVLPASFVKQYLAELYMVSFIVTQTKWAFGTSG
jgi:hypothetical protein